MVPTFAASLPGIPAMAEGNKRWTRSTSVVDVLGRQVEAAALGIGAQLPELGLRVLAAIKGGDAGIDGGVLHGVSIACKKGVPILLANSPEQNRCGKICSHHGTRLDKNRISALSYSTIMHNKTCSCRLVVISPTVSEFLCDRPQLWIASGSGSPSAGSSVAASYGSPRKAAAGQLDLSRPLAGQL